MTDRRIFRVTAFVLGWILLMLSGCSAAGKGEAARTEDTVQQTETAVPEMPVSAAEEEREETGPEETVSPGPETTEDGEQMIYAHVNGSVLEILAAENSSAEAFLVLLESGDVTVEMHDYGSFEKVGPLGTELPTNDGLVTTEPGDLILYQGNQITIYYDVNSWSFTRLGKVQGLSQEELKSILGSGDVTVTFSLSAESRTAENGRVLVVFFSCTGHTKPLAEYTAEELDADLYEIQAKIPYTDEDIRYYTDCRADREQNDPEARPEIAGSLPDTAGYDTVFIGYPIWHGQAPRILYTFLETVDLSGKRIVPFCTSHSSPLGMSAENLHPLAPDAHWDEGKRFEIGTEREEIVEWLMTLGFLSE